MDEDEIDDEYLPFKCPSVEGKFLKIFRSLKNIKKTFIEMIFTRRQKVLKSSNQVFQLRPIFGLALKPYKTLKLQKTIFSDHSKLLKPSTLITELKQNRQFLRQKSTHDVEIGLDSNSHIDIDI